MMEDNKIKKSDDAKKLKNRSDKYEEKVSFDGTFDELLELSIKPKKNHPDTKNK